MRNPGRHTSGFQPDCKTRRPLYGKYVASPAYIKAHGSPETPEELVTHQALMQGMKRGEVMDGDKILTIRPQGRFKADNGAALVVAAAAGLRYRGPPRWPHPGLLSIPARW